MTAVTVDSRLLNARSTVLESEALRVSHDDTGGGIHLVAKRHLRKGTCVASCHAAAIALDSSFRSSHCGFCCAMTEVSPCPDCQLVSTCRRCHPCHGKEECRGLQTLSQTMMQVFGPTSIVESVYMLAVRLMVQRWVDQIGSPTSGEDESPSPIDWKLFDALHTKKVQSEETFATFTKKLCAALANIFNAPATDFWSQETLVDVLGKIFGCAHGVTDTTLPLGCQTLGMAIFPLHSFYNHACAPTAFFACQIIPDAATPRRDHVCSVLAKVHCLSDVVVGESVTLSYIPTSGLDGKERHRLLSDGYGFDCGCRACVDTSNAHEWEKLLQLPNGADVDSLRQVQFTCNESLVRARQMNGNNPERSGLLEHCVVMTRMSLRGIQNQQIPASHEVSIEAHRLLASTLSLIGEQTDADKEYDIFFNLVNPIRPLFDPVVLIKQHAEYAALLIEGEAQQSHLDRAMCLARTALGAEHPLTLSIEQSDNDPEQNSAKKRKLK